MLSDSKSQLAADFTQAMASATADDLGPSVREAFEHLRRLLGAGDS